MLDLDHTLVHSKDIPPEQLRFQRSRKGTPNYHVLVDELQSIYEAKFENGGFLVKLRPFLAEFLKKLHDDAKYEVHYYTAGTNQYGYMIIEILRTELIRKYGEGKENFANEIKDIVSSDRLIGRDDSRKFDNLT